MSKTWSIIVYSVGGLVATAAVATTGYVMGQKKMLKKAKEIADSKTDQRREGAQA